MPPSKPESYGRWWNKADTGPVWYRQLFEPRRMVHEAFMEWSKTCGPLTDVLEVGCGCAIEYPDFFSASRYVGVDISAKEIAWSRANDKRAWHAYHHGDFTELVGDELVIKPRSFDLVFAHAVIDHVPDIDAFLGACIRASRGWIYLTAYRGWFPTLEEHYMVWSEQTACYYNDLSQTKIRQMLEQSGCAHFELVQVPVDNGPIKVEMAIIAQSPTLR